MIISASRRTDLPAFFPDWTIGKIRNYLLKDPDTFTVFWTKNAGPMMKHLDLLKDRFYFQYSVNHYPDIYEPGIPALPLRISNFKTLAYQYGDDAVVWRYDPIFLSDKVTISDVLTGVKEVGDSIAPYTKRLVFSFVDMYAKLYGGKVFFRQLGLQEREFVMDNLRDLAHDWDIELQSCTEWGRPPWLTATKCIDPEIIARITGEPAATYVKDPSQRAGCGCCKSVDIGKYGTCQHKCVYCYASHT